MLGPTAGQGAKFAAQELSNDLFRLTGVRVNILSTGKLPSEPAILIGGPAENIAVKEIVAGGFDKFAAVKPGGFVLSTRRAGKFPVIIAGGNDDASTMYAIFDLIERLGITFRLSGDIVPETRKANLAIPQLNVVRNPAIALRGFLFEATMHESITALSYADYVRLLDQMAKMKFNYLEFWWFPWAPWVNYSYHGENKLIGDVSTEESAYLNTMYNGYGDRMTDEVTVGKHWFPRKRIIPEEFENVHTSEQAFTTAQDLLRKVIRYAASKHIQVWLVDEMSSLPPNLGRYGDIAGDRPFEAVFGAIMNPLDPVNREIQLIKLKAIIKAYPEAAGYYLNFPEVYFTRDEAKTRAFYADQEKKFQPMVQAMKPWIDWQHVGVTEMLDNNIGFLDLFKYLTGEIRQSAPDAKIGLMTVGRGYVMPLFNQMLPANIPFSNFDSGARCGWTPGGMPMSYFGKMGSRQRIMTAYGDDDCDILGPQFNVTTYTNVDHIFSDGVKYGLTGVVPWLIQPRGTETNTNFLADAAWDPELTAEQFYKDYTERIFGGAAAPEMYRAYMVLEKNERYLADPPPPVTMRQPLRPGTSTMGCCGGLGNVKLIYDYSEQVDPFDGPKGKEWNTALERAPNTIAYFSGSIPQLDEAIRIMHAIKPKVAPRGQHEIDYLICRLQAYRDAMQGNIEEWKAILAFDKAFHDRASISHEQFVAALQASLKEFQDAHRQALVTTTEYAKVIDYPSDLEDLYHLNASMLLGFDLVDQWIEQIVNYHEGKPYNKHIPFERVFTGNLKLGDRVQNEM